MAYSVYMHDIPPDLMYSMDETFFYFVPMGGARTYDQIGALSVPVIGAEDKRGGTVLLTCKATGEMVPFQAIYGGKTPLSEPGGKAKDGSCKDTVGARFRAEAEAAGHRVTHSHSHWCVEDTYKEFVTTVIVPDYLAVCKRLGLVAGAQKMLLQQDLYAVHRSESVVTWLRETYPYIILAFVPGGCTGAVQIPDTCLNRPFKAAIKESYCQWVIEQLTSQLQETGILPANMKLDIALATVRPWSLAWLLSAFKQLLTISAGIRRAYEKAGTMQLWDKDFQRRSVREVARLFGENSREAAQLQIMGLPDAADEAAAAAAVDVEERRKSRAAEADMDGEGGEDEISFVELAQRLQDTPCGEPLPLQKLIDADIVDGEDCPAAPKAAGTSAQDIAEAAVAVLGPPTREQMEVAVTLEGVAAKRKAPKAVSSSLLPMKKAAVVVCEAAEVVVLEGDDSSKIDEENDDDPDSAFY